MPTDIVMKDLSLHYKDTRAVDQISCTIQEPGVYGLIGRNGAGKTSLLSLLASYRQPTSGTLTIRGEDPFENWRVMQDVHLVYARDVTEESDTVKTFLKECARYRSSFDMDYARVLLKRFGLNEKKPINKLSEGMKAMVNIIEGLAGNAEITMFDEVHHGLDAPSRQLFYDAVLECQEKRPRIMVLSTHLVSEMAYLFDHVLILHKGRLMTDEPYDAVVERGATVTGEAGRVDEFSLGKAVIDRRTLGKTASVMIYGTLSSEDMRKAEEMDLELSGVSLQELFIYLTKESNHESA